MNECPCPACKYIMAQSKKGIELSRDEYVSLAHEHMKCTDPYYGLSESEKNQRIISKKLDKIIILLEKK